jgi:hypothetical protein
MQPLLGDVVSGLEMLSIVIPASLLISFRGMTTRSSSGETTCRLGDGQQGPTVAPLRGGRDSRSSSSSEHEVEIVSRDAFHVIVEELSIKVASERKTGPANL